VGKRRAALRSAEPRGYNRPVSSLLKATAGTSIGRLGLSTRVAVLAALFFAEKILLGAFVDFERAQAAQGLGAALRIVQHWSLRFLVTWAAATAAIAWVRGGEAWRSIDTMTRVIPIRPSWWLLHAALLVPLMALSYWLYRDLPPAVPFALVACLWIGTATISTLSAFAGMAPWRIWQAAIAALRTSALYAGAVALVAASVMALSQGLWVPTARLTFELVRRCLAPFVPALTIDADNLVLGTDRFSVQISEICSGLEGMGLIIAFCTAWLLYFRRDYRFPRALLMIPVGLLLVFALNVLRIAALVLIGDAGFPGVASYGFHSQAGWIAFNVAVCGLCYVTRRDTWFSRAPSMPAAAADREFENPTAAYVMPLLAVLAAGILSRATASDFEHLAPLRLLAGAGVLALYRRRLAHLDWRWSWRGPAVGLLVFLLWVLAARYLLGPSGAPYKLVSLGTPWRWLWIGSQLAASIAVVPIVEELAYRGFLMRRLRAKDFESVSYRSVGYVPLIVSALAFGLLQGPFWLPATVAGLAYGALLMRTGRLGEAIAAHVSANALIAATVLGWDQWQLWLLR
jgi:exosortase E/protease (VPEID-CTERM system)